MSPASAAQSAAEGFARLAASCCGVEAGLVISLQDGRFEIVGSHGLRGAVEAMRGSSVFAATMRRDDVFEVVQRPKAERDQRKGEQHVYRFYAGMRVHAVDSTPIGLVAVLDPSARMLEPRARDQFRLLAQGLASLDMGRAHDVLEVVVRSYERSPEPTLIYECHSAEMSSRLIAANRSFERMSGMHPSALLVHGTKPFAGPKTDHKIQVAMLTARRAGKPMRATVALYPPGNVRREARWFEVSGYPVSSDTPGTSYWVESYHDVTERALRITELASERNRLQFTLTSMDDAIVTADRTGKLRFMNHAARTLLDLGTDRPQSFMIDDGVLQLRDIETEQVLVTPLAHVRRNGKIMRERAVIIAQNEARRYVEYAVAPIERPKQENDGFVIVLRDVTEEESLTRRLSFEASHDQLTSIYNRRYFDQALARGLNVLKHNDESQHALAFLDLDRFKIINDTCGHAAGDDVLRNVSQLFKAQLRAHDVIARFGGDEFAILMHDCPISVAARVMERIRAKLRDYAFVWEGHEFRLGVSIGLAEITSKTPNAQAVMKEADAACYADKLSRKTKQAGLPSMRGASRDRNGVSWLR